MHKLLTGQWNPVMPWLQGYKTYLSLESTQLSIWLNSVLATSNDGSYLHTNWNQNLAHSVLLSYEVNI
jgi:hypothetical protein